MTIQKYFRGYRVKVQEVMPKEMAHFAAGFEAIIIGSFTDQFLTNQPDDYKNYELLQLEDGKPVNTGAWYLEDQLTLLSDDRAAGEALISAWVRRDEIVKSDVEVHATQDDVAPDDEGASPRQ